MPVYRAETKFSTNKAGYSALSCVTANMIWIIEHSLINTTRLTHSLDDLICNLPFTRLAPSDFRSGTPQLFPHCPLG